MASYTFAQQLSILLFGSKDKILSPKVFAAFLKTGVNRKMIYKSLFYDYGRSHEAGTIKELLNLKTDRDYCKIAIHSFFNF